MPRERIVSAEGSPTQPGSASNSIRQGDLIAALQL